MDKQRREGDFHLGNLVWNLTLERMKATLKKTAFDLGKDERWFMAGLWAAYMSCYILTLADEVMGCW